VNSQALSQKLKRQYSLQTYIRKLFSQKNKLHKIKKDIEKSSHFSTPKPTPLSISKSTSSF